MNLQHRIDLLIECGRYILSNDDEWQAVKQEAGYKNGWFIPEFTNVAVQHIGHSYLSKPALENWSSRYNIPAENHHPKTVGVVMAGNIPLVGFHDFLSVFLSGHRIAIKPSSKDETLIKHLVKKMIEWDASVEDRVAFQPMLKNCDAYITTGSNNSSRYFDYYFGKYPHIIRRNRSSLAVIRGNETATELDQLADDVYLYFGLGCRNVTKMYVPENYDFVPLLTSFRKYNYLADHQKYKNNYDYNLAILLLNNQYYMSNESILLVENKSLFSPISQLNYEYYKDAKDVKRTIEAMTDVQCVTGHHFLPFGQAQYPGIDEFADGVDTLAFLLKI